MLSDLRLRTGSVFAEDFRIVAPLAEGGMGVVYRAEQLSTGEERAVKVLKPTLLADGTSRERFTQEATLGSHIESDHVVKVIGAGIDDETGIPWIAMELLEGRTLAQRIRARGPMSRRSVLHVFAQLCHALGAAHRAGIVHRDLKPENIFVAETNSLDARPTVKLLDFGIAKVMQDFETSVTATAVIGSPLWMAPEQVRLGKVKPATDVWALGLLAFWLMTGRHYWRAAQVKGPGQAEALLHEKLYEPIEPPSRRAVALGITTALPDGFDEWFKNCVARDPDGRFRDAIAAFAALSSLLTRRHSRWVPHVRAGVVGAAVAVAILVGSSFVARRARAGATVGLRADLAPVARQLAHVTFAPATHDEPAAPIPTRPHADAPTHVHPTHAITHVRTVGHTVPQSAGYTLHAQPGWDARCPAHARAWQVTPDWSASLTHRIEQRTTNVAQEARVAERATTDEARADMQREVARQRTVLEQERAAVERQIESNASAERDRSSSRARETGCSDQGLVVQSDRLYAVWCCP
jgi:serine/threonine-protein kinase